LNTPVDDFFSMVEAFFMPVEPFFHAGGSKKVVSFLAKKMLALASKRRFQQKNNKFQQKVGCL
jgi:hypothetical protein